MAVPVEMPKLGNTVEEAILVRWRKAKGEKVAAGEVIAEIETDKAAFEIPAPASGTLLETFASEGDLVPVYTYVCVIGEPGEPVEPFRPVRGTPAPSASTPAAGVPSAPSASEAPAAAPAQPSTPAATQLVQPAEPRPAPPPEPAQFPLSPRARRYLEENNLAPPPIQGSGPGGRLFEADVRDYYGTQRKLSHLARRLVQEGYEIRRTGSGTGGMILSRDLDTPGLKMTKVRELIARRMRDSLAHTAQYTLHSSACASGLLALRARFKAAGPPLDGITINDMVMYCVVKTLLEMPELNAELIEGKIYRRPYINLGFACDTDRGLLVPVVKDCQLLSLSELAARVKELTQQATSGTISPDDLTGGTFTVTNLGPLGIESFTPILNPPQVAILGVDAIQLRPVRRDGNVEFRDFIGLSLTCDHQVIDGAPGARFLKLLREKIESVESWVDPVLQ